MNPGVRNTVIILLIIVFAIAAGSYFSFKEKLASEEKAKIAERESFASVQGNVLSPERKISVPQLVMHDGSAFTEENLQGQWSILFFGFTNCMHVCPTAMSVLTQAKKLAEEKGIKFPTVYLVSVDPERDTPEAMKKFVKGFDSDFNGVTGDPEMLKALSLQMSVIYMRANSTDGDEESGKEDNYQVDHSSAFLLLNKQGHLKAFLNPPHTPEKVMTDIKTILDASS
jgi:protein SCO1/2